MSARRPAMAAIFAVLSAMALVVLDAGVVNVALPVLSASMAITPSGAILAVTAYQAGLVMALFPAGALGERLGHRRVFVLGVIVFALAALACAISPNLAWLVTARLIQGVGGAAVMALGVAVLRLALPRDRLGAAIGWNALTVALASAAAPAVGAALVAAAGWRVLFLVNLPIAALSLLAARGLPRRTGSGARPDLAAMALNAGGFGLLILGVVLAQARLPTALLALGASLSGFIVLVRGERSKAAPLIPLDLLARAPFRISVVGSICCFTAQGLGLLALPFLLHSRGLAPLAVGISLAGWPLAVALTAPIAGRLADRAPTAWLCGAGGGVLSLGLAGAALAPSGATPVFITLSGVGFGLFQSPNNRNLFLSAPPERSGAAGGMQATARVSGQTLGSLTAGALFGLGASAPALALSAGAVMALAAGAVSLASGRRLQSATTAS